MVVMIQDNIYCNARTVSAEIYGYNFCETGYESSDSTKAPIFKF
jgi:hypothetical protein